MADSTVDEPFVINHRLHLSWDIEDGELVVYLYDEVTKSIVSTMYMDKDSLVSECEKDEATAEENGTGSTEWVNFTSNLYDISMTLAETLGLDQSKLDDDRDDRED